MLLSFIIYREKSMKNFFSKKGIALGIVFLVSLFFVLFVGRTFNTKTLQRDRNLTLNGITNFRKGLDISGGTKLVYKIDYSKYDEQYGANETAELTQVKKNIESIIIKNIDARISALGVSDYKAYTQNLNNQTQIVVEIGGVADLDQAKKMIGKTVELEFRLLNDKPKDAESAAQRRALAESLRTEAVQHPDKMITENQNKGGDGIQANLLQGKLDQLPTIYQNNAKLLASLATGEVSPVLSGTYISANFSGLNLANDIEGFTFFRVLQKDQTVGTYTIEEVFVRNWQEWIVAKGNDGAILNGAYFTLAQASVNQVGGEPTVSISFNEKGKDLFCQITKNNIHRQMAIFIGGEIATAATIQDAICDGRAQISGGFDAAQARLVAENLNSGNMPAPLTLMQEEKVSPSLWDSAFRGALIATLVGSLAIILYIFFIYGWRKAVVTTLTIIFYFTILLAIIKLIDYALSLSGIAAIILSIGMAVDANILIFERMNEEVQEGKSFTSAINAAEHRSRSAIRDGQISTLLIWVLLFAFGINMFKGFGYMIVLTAILTLGLNVPFIKESLHLIYGSKKNS